MPVKVLTTYEDAVAELQRRAQEHNDLGEFDAWAETANRADELVAWLGSGRRGPCPVDLAGHGLAVQMDGVVPASVEAPPGSLPAQAEAETVPEPDLDAVDARPESVSPSAEAEARQAGSPAEEQAIAIHMTMEAGEGARGEEASPGAEEPAPEAAESPGPAPDTAGAEAPVPPEAEPSEPDSLEAAELHKQLAAARRYLEQGQWREAVALGRLVADRAAAHPPLQEAAGDLLDRAQRELSTRLEEALGRGNDARSAGEDDEARRHYRAALELDPDNADARRALLALDGELSDQLSRTERTLLRAGLKERRDLKRQGEAVYRAEALDAEGKLPAEFEGLLREARAAYDETRRAHGEETTLMRFADLVGRKAARDRIAERVALGEKHVLDVTINTLRPAFDVLQDASRLYEERSSDTAQYEVDRANKALPAHPVGARQRLLAALEQPFFEHHRRVLEEKLREAEGLIERKEAAEKLPAQADEADDPVRALDLILRAVEIFPHLDGLADRAARARQTAADWLVAAVRRHHRQAEVHLDDDDYRDARAEVDRAEAVPAAWPEKEKPPELEALATAAADLRRRIDARQALRREFDKLTEGIRKRIADPKTRAAGRALFKQEFGEDPNQSRFAGFTQLRILISEMDQYADFGEQLTDAELARKRGDWERVYELAEKMKKSARAGQSTEQADELLHESAQELDIARALRHLEEEEIKAAQAILSRLIQEEKDPARGTALRERLKDAQATIDRAIADSPAMQGLYDRAVSLLGLKDSPALFAFLNPGSAPVGGRSSLPVDAAALATRLREEMNRRGAAERLEALRLLRHVGGDPVAERPAGWPEYRLTLRTSEARKLARELAVALREGLLEPLAQAFAQRQARQPDDESLRVMAEHARSLREAGLLRTEEERAVARWLEVAQGRAEAQVLEGLGDWERAVAIWRELDKHHPRTVEAELRRARIEQAVAQAEGMVRAGQSEAALKVLQAAQDEPGLARAWRVLLALADVQAARGDFNQAFAVLADAERQPDAQAQAAQKLQDLRREQAIQQILARVELDMHADRPREALRTLQEAVNRPPTNDSRRLKNRRDGVFAKEESRLLQAAAQAQARPDASGQVQAVVSLMDLQDLEELIKLPEPARQSARHLQPLRAQLTPAARSLIKSAQAFHPAGLLDKALAEANHLAGRLQTFVEVARLFHADLSDDLVRQGLEQQRGRIAALLESLNGLKEALQEALQPPAWETALRTGNFSVLDQHLERVRALRLDEVLEAQNFEHRLEEFKEIHAFLVDEIVAVKREFQSDERFGDVVLRVRRLAARPDLRPGGRGPWRQVQERDYDDIRRLMDGRLTIVDLYGDGQDIVGWARVEQAAEERKTELEAWELWDKHCTLLMDSGERARNATLEHTTSTPMIHVRESWDRVRMAAQAAVEALARGPRKDDQPVPLRCGRAEAIKSQAKARLGVVEGWLRDAADSLNELDLLMSGPGRGMPSAQDFKDALDKRDWDELERLLKRAEEIGTTDPTEQKRIDLHRRLLDKARKPKTNPFWKRG